MTTIDDTHPELLASSRAAAARPREQGIGLCLSGGGFRATLFNLGALWRLNELGLLPKLNMVTSVSGGSIVNGVLALAWNDLQFDGNGVAQAFGGKVVAPVRDFCGREIAVPAAVWGLLNPFRSIGDEMVERYESLYGKKTLQDLPAKPAPAFVFYATNLQTGSSVRMSRKYLADYKIGIVDKPQVPIAKAVAASSAFPPVLSPQCMDLDPQAWRAVDGTSVTSEQIKSHMVLTDGGVYDNMGMEAVWDRWSTVLISDAGAPLQVEEKPHEDWTRQMVRVLDVITDQARALRKRWLVDDFLSGTRSGAYWGIRSRVADYQLPNPIVKDSDRIAKLATIRTHLDPFSPEEQGQLINWGYAICDIALRKWQPGLVPAGNVSKLPVPEQPI